MIETVYVYTEGDLTPKAIDVIKDIIAERVGTHVRIRGYNKTLPFRGRFLVLGKVTVPDAIAPNHHPVYTYSVAQIMTKANAATVLAAGVRQVLGARTEVPFDPVLDTVRIARAFMQLRELDPAQPVAIDIETSGNLGKTHTPEEVQILTVAFYQPGHAPVVLYGTGDLLSDNALSRVLDWAQINALAEIMPTFQKAVYHNGKFDTRVLNRVLGVELKVWFDTMLAHHVLNQAAGQHGLKALCMLYFGADDWDSSVKKYAVGGGHYENVPRRNLITYNALDVFWTYELFKLLEPQIEADEEAQKALFLEQRAAEFLLRVERRGIPIRMDYIEQLADELIGEKRDQILELWEVTGNDNFNPNSPKQVAAFLSSQGVLVESTNKETLETLLSDGGLTPRVRLFLERLLLFRKAAKMLGTYAEGWKAHARDGRVHPTFLVHGTSTGRLSSTAPNAQNVPRDKRIRGMVGV